MAYPNEIVSSLTAAYRLSASQQEQLRNALLMAELRPLIEGRGFNPEDLIVQLEAPSGPYVSVVSEVAIRQIIADPGQLASYKAAILADPRGFIEWDKIRVTIAEINELPRSRTRQRKELATELFRRMFDFQQFITSHPMFTAEHFVLSKNLLQYMNAMIEPIEKAARIYFEHLYESMGRSIEDIAFTPKKDGVQLGTTMLITYTVPEAAGAGDTSAAAGGTGTIRTKYFVKTHQHGSTSGASSVKPMDPKELFVYKVLEYTGYGPKTHFFFNPLTTGGFFIATQDIAFTKMPGRDKFFTKYTTLKPGYDEGGDDYSPELAQGISRTDILSRIFCLQDVSTNPDNFGRVTVDGERNKWKIVDFRIDSRAAYLIHGIFEGFREGNGMYNYTGFLGRLLRDRPEAERMTTAVAVIDELESGRPQQSGAGNKMPLIVAIDRAFCEIARYVQQHAEALGVEPVAVLGGLSSLDLSSMDDGAILTELSRLPRENQGDFGRYLLDSKINLEELTRGIQARHAEFSGDGGAVAAPGTGV